MSAAVINLFPYRPHPDAELIAGVLVRLEEASLDRVTVHRLADDQILVFIGGEVIARLSPAQARTAGHALFHEQAFAGCNEVAAQLIEASVAPSPDWAPAAEIVQIQPVRCRPVPAFQIRTGFAASAALFGMVFVVFVAPIARHAIGQVFG